MRRIGYADWFKDCQSPTFVQSHLRKPELAPSPNCHPKVSWRVGIVSWICPYAALNHILTLKGFTLTGSANGLSSYPDILKCRRAICLLWETKLQTLLCLLNSLCCALPRLKTKAHAHRLCCFKRASLCHKKREATFLYPFGKFSVISFVTSSLSPFLYFENM